VRTITAPVATGAAAGAGGPTTTGAAVPAGARMDRASTRYTTAPHGIASSITRTHSHFGRYGARGRRARSTSPYPTTARTSAPTGTRAASRGPFDNAVPP